MSPKLDRSYFVADSDTAGISWRAFIDGLYAWTILQHEKLGAAPTVREASEAWHVLDGTIIAAAGEVYWMSVEGPDDDPTKQKLELDGE